MKIGKDTQNAARRLFRLCMDGNAVAEDRVRLIARKIAERKPRNYAALPLFKVPCPSRKRSVP